MKKQLLFLLLIASACSAVKVQRSTSVSDYKSLHKNALFIDSHNDMLTKIVDEGAVFDSDLTGITHSDLNRMLQSGLDAQFFSVWSDGTLPHPFAYANRQIDSLDAVIARNPARMCKALSSVDILLAEKEHKLAALVGVEGGHHIENSLDKLEELYNRGTRYMTLTWNNSTDWATSNTDEWNDTGVLNAEGKKGLTAFGRQVVQKMNGLGMLVDVSHVGVQTFWDVMETTTKPVIASHSSAFALYAHPRNLNDDQLKAVAKNGGVVQVNFYTGFIDSTFARKKDAFLEKYKVEKDSLLATGMSTWNAENTLFAKHLEESEALRAPFELLMAHLYYMLDLIGADHVGIGSDFDGISFPPARLDDVMGYALITKDLVEKGYSETDINKILGGNLLRVLKANERNK